MATWSWQIRILRTPSHRVIFPTGLTQMLRIRAGQKAGECLLTFLAPPPSPRKPPTKGGEKQSMRTDVSESEALWVFSCRGLGMSKRPGGLSMNVSCRWGGRAERTHPCTPGKTRFLHTSNACGCTRKQREHPNNVQNCQSTYRSERSHGVENWCFG